MHEFQKRIGAAAPNSSSVWNHYGSKLETFDIVFLLIINKKSCHTFSSPVYIIVNYNIINIVCIYTFPLLSMTFLFK